MTIPAINPLWGIPHHKAGFCLEPGEHHPGPCPGGGKGGGILKRLLPGKKAVAKGPKRGPGTGRDITKEIDYAGLPKLGTFTVTSGPDEALAAIAKQQGFDAKPGIGTKEDLDRAVKEGGRELWRGMEGSKDGSRTAADYAEEFRSGDAFFGLGQHGNGIYAGDKSTANKYSKYQPGGRVRMVLPKGARTTTTDELKKMLPARHKEFDEHGKKLLKEAQDPKGREGAVAAYEKWMRGRSRTDVTLQDLGRLAAAMGYDAYEVQRGGAGNFWVIVNRGALLVEKAEDQVTASAARIQACKTIKVAGRYPPGPCPKHLPGTPGKKAVAKRRPATKTSGKDVTGRLDYGQLAAADVYGPDGNKQLAAIAAVQGFDAPPQLSDEAFQAALAAGGRRLWRGIQTRGTTTGAQRQQQFRDGPAEFGTGIFGNGYYFSNDHYIATSYADFDEDNVGEYVLPRTARTITFPELLQEMSQDPQLSGLEARTQAQRQLLADLENAPGIIGQREALERFLYNQSRTITGRNAVLSEPGNYAMAHGYDAIIVPFQQDDLAEIVLLNRGAIIGKGMPAGQGGPGSGRDLLASLDLNAIGKLSKRSTAGGDEQMAAIAEQQGFDALPELGTPQQLDAAVAAGGRELWRGTQHDSVSRRSGEELAEDFRTGPVFYGQGISGNGIYTSTDREQALGYTSQRDMRSVNRMVLKPGAKVISYDQMLGQIAAEIPADTAERIAALEVVQRDLFRPGRYSQDTVRRATRAAEGAIEPQDWLWMDGSQWAMAHGYDAVLHGYGDARDDDPAVRKEIVLLNRGAALAERAAEPPRTLQEIFGEDFTSQASVTACLKPGQVHPGPCKGPGKLGLMRRPRVRAKTTAARSVKPVTAKQVTRARDITGDLDYEALENLPQEGAKGNEVLAFIGTQQGFTGIPRTVPREEFQKIIDGGGRHFMRGVKPRFGKTAGQIQEEFRNGDVYYGGGRFGSGIYLSNQSWIADTYADRNDPRALAQFALPKDARTVFYDDLLKEMAQAETPGQKAMTELQRQLLTDLQNAKDSRDLRDAWSEFDFQQRMTGTARDRLLADPGLFAMAKGYDALLINLGEGMLEAVVLNRGKLIARQPDADRITASAARDAVLIEACMPPHVPVPKPGPCKGTKRKIADAVTKPAKKTPAKKTAAPKKTATAKKASPAAAETSHERAVRRQKEIDTARNRAGLLAELEEIAVINEADAGRIGPLLSQYTRQRDLEDDPQLQDLIRAAGTGDLTQIREALEKTAASLGLQRVGGDLYESQQIVPFDRVLHRPIDTGIANGAAAEIVRPGYRMFLEGFQPGGEDLLLEKALVIDTDLPIPRAPAPPAAGVRPYVGPQITIPAADKELFDTVYNFYARSEDPFSSSVNAEQVRQVVSGHPQGRDSLAYYRATAEGQVAWQASEFGREYAPGLSQQLLEQEGARRTREAFAGKPIAIRTTEVGLGKILSSGRFKSQFETGGSKGTFNPVMREGIEHANHGYPKDGFPPQKRPIYGYVMLEGEKPAGDPLEDGLSGYGRVQVVLKPEVRSRTTAMFGDSIGNATQGIPSPVDDPAWYSFTWPTRGTMNLALRTMDRDPSSVAFRERNYAEAQIHAGPGADDVPVRVSDIAKVIFPSVPVLARRNQLEAAGIPWQVLEAQQ